MSFKAYKSNFRRLIDRFGLKTLEREDVIMLSSIRPVTNIDDLAKEIQIDIFPGIVANATGWIKIGDVPEGKRYTISAISCVRSAGDGTITKMAVQGENALAEVLVKEQAADISIHTYILNHPIVMKERQSVKVFVDALTTATTYYPRVLYTSEDAY